MANPHKGEVGFEVDGKAWILRYSANALCTLEDDLDMGTAALVAELQKTDGVRMSTLRTVFWAGLQDRQPDVTREEAGELMSALGFANVGPLIGEAFGHAFAEDKSEAKSKARPRKGGKAGTGNGS